MHNTTFSKPNYTSGYEDKELRKSLNY